MIRFLLITVFLFPIALALMPSGLAQNKNDTSGNSPYPNTSAKDMDGDLLQGFLHFDHLLSDGLDPVRKVFMSGGADAHGGWNYKVYRTTTTLEVTGGPSSPMDRR